MSPEKNDQQNVARFILPTSGNLLGLCFTILSFIKVTHVADHTGIDEILVVAIVLFLSSCVSAYLSIRLSTRKSLYERISEIIFLVGLTLLALSAIAVGLHLIQ